MSLRPSSGRSCRLVCVVALAVAGLVSGCDGPATEPFVPPSLIGEPSATPSPTPLTPRYRSETLDLCRQTSLAPLADLKPTVKEANPKPNPLIENSTGCFFSMAAPGGSTASLLVQVTTPDTVAAAQQWFKTGSREPRMRLDGAVAGLGDEAEAYHLDETVSGVRHSEYFLQVRIDNAVVWVWMNLGAKEYTPKEQLARRVRTILENTLPLVPRS